MLQHSICNGCAFKWLGINSNHRQMTAHSTTQQINDSVAMRTKMRWLKCIQLSVYDIYFMHKHNGNGQKLTNKWKGKWFKRSGCARQTTWNEEQWIESKRKNPKRNAPKEIAGTWKSHTKQAWNILSRLLLSDHWRRCYCCCCCCCYGGSSNMQSQQTLTKSPPIYLMAHKYITAMSCLGTRSLSLHFGNLIFGLTKLCCAMPCHI